MNPVLLLRFISEHAAMFVVLVVGAILAATGVVIQTILAQRRRDEIFRLRRRVASLENSSHVPVQVAKPSDPLVLSSRWMPAGTAATSSDGGCFVYVDRVTGESASFTLRVDGEAVFVNHTVRTGERLEASGKYGTYTLALDGVQGAQAYVGVALRNRHREVS